MDLVRRDVIESTKDTIGMSMHFGDADPVVVCLALGCKKHFHGDSRAQALIGWSDHISKDHREDWEDEPEIHPFRQYRKTRIDRLEFGSRQFGHNGRHTGIGTLECPTWPHHHCDEFCEMPTIDEIIMAGLDVKTFRPGSRE
jgi:hypothetical protein